jgi:hypothetical protein
VKKASEVLARLLEKSGTAGGSHEGSVFGEWQDIAGVSLAEHCRVYDVRHHSLFVEADHPGWMQLLLLSKRKLLSKLRQRFPQLEIRDIRVRVGKEEERPSEARTLPSPPPAAVEPDPAVEQAVAGVADSELREKLRQLLLEIERRNPRNSRNAPG